MSQPIEKYSPVGVNKDDNFVSIQRDGSRIYLPGFCFDIVNARMYSNEDGRKRSGQPLKGFEEIDLPKPVNISPTEKYRETCLGMAPYAVRDVIILLIWNSEGYHRILKYNIISGVFTTLVQGSILNFTENSVVSENRYGFNGDYFRWTDFNNEIRQTNINETLINPSEIEISYLKTPPINRVEFELDTNGLHNPRYFDSTITVNNIKTNSYKFVARFLYKDNTYSVFGQHSFYSLASDDPGLDELPNRIDIYLRLLDEEIKVIKSVQIAYIINGDPTHYLFKTVEVNDIPNNIVRATFLGVEGGEAVSESEFTKPFENIPSISRNFIVSEDRAFLTADKIGDDLSKNNIDLFLTTLDNYGSLLVADGQISGFGEDGYIEGKFKEKGIYQIGVILYDGKGRFTTVDAIKDIRIENSGNASTIVAQITGNVPKKYTHYSLAISINKQQGIYMHTPSIPLFYIGDVDAYTSPPIAANINERYYKTNINDSPGALDNVSQVHFVLPSNIPFLPEKGMIMRIRKGNDDKFVELSVIDFLEDTNAVVVDYNSEKIAFPSEENMKIDVEIYSPYNISERLFNEASRIYPIEDGVIPKNTIGIKGDTFTIQTLQGTKWYFPSLALAAIPYEIYDTSVFMAGYEIPSPTFGNTIENNIKIFEVKFVGIVQERETNVIGFSRKVDVRVFNRIPKYVSGPDYNKIVRHIGRVNIEQANTQERNDLPIVLYSNKEILGSNINGISVVDILDNYVLSNDTGPIIAMVKVQNIILVIHSQKSSSLYIGEGILKAGEDTLLSKVDNVIGDDYEHTRTHGTIHPESVKVHDGTAFWWDQIEGVVVQYTTGGLVPISFMKMASYFKQLARKYDRYKDQIKVIGSIDPKNSEYLISFPKIGDLEGETWAYNFDERIWCARYEYVPEASAHIQDQMFSFKNGKLWSHQGRSDGKVNHFYGEQKYSKYTFVINPAPDKNKKFQNLHIESDVLSDKEESIVVKVSNDRGQETYMRMKDFKKVNNKYIGPILRDINSKAKDGKLARFNGNDIDSQYILIELTIDSDKSYVLNNISVVFNISPYTR